MRGGGGTAAEAAFPTSNKSKLSFTPVLTLWQQKLFSLRAQLIPRSFKACGAGGICNGVTSPGRKVGHGLHTEAVSPLGSVSMHHVQPVGADRASHAGTSAALSGCLPPPLTVNGGEGDSIPGWVFTWASNCWCNSESGVFIWSGLFAWVFH